MYLCTCMLSWWGDFPRHQELLRSVRLRSYLQGYLEVPPLQSFTNYPRSHRFGSHYLKMKSERKTSTGPTPVRRNSKDGKFPASQADTGDSIGRVTWADMIGLSVPATSQRHPEGAVSVLRASTATAATNPSGTQTRTRRSERSAEKRLVEAERPPVYDALREGCIRLVQIGQDPLTGFIECRTEHFPLEAPPRYTALSYACGARPADFNIKLNGKEWYIRKNLLAPACADLSGLTGVDVDRRDLHQSREPPGANSPGQAHGEHLQKCIACPRLARTCLREQRFSNVRD
jgi:hypothetical protein